MEVLSSPRIAPAVEKSAAPLGKEPSWDIQVGWDAARKSEVARLLHGDGRVSSEARSILRLRTPP
eukprot:7076281-Pyramimonas_sp.AAC.1